MAATALFGLVGTAWPRSIEDETPLSWETLVLPLEPGGVVHDGYQLSPPRRGEEHDVVFTARRPARPGIPGAHVEVHVVNRGQWEGVPETASFGVAWEVPRSSAPEDDLAAVNTRLMQAIAANDPGGLGPVDAIPLHSPTTLPGLSRVLSSLIGVRGWVAAAALVLLAVALGAGRWGTLIAATALGLLGLCLRVAHLGVPFVRDQDVQRVVTGSLPVFDILTGQGLMDRHPPLYFLVLHVAEWGGQDEWIVRLPAALCGAICAPVLLWVGAGFRSSTTPGLAAVAALLAVSPVLIASSREVSDIPLFTIFLLAMAGFTARNVVEPTRARRIGVCVFHALALWTYYLAPFAVVGELGVLGLLYWRAQNDGGRRRDHIRTTLRWLALGIVAGSPAIVLAVATLFRDFGARVTASRVPELAWGDWTPLEMLSQLGLRARDAVGLPMCILLAVGGVAAIAALLRQSREAASSRSQGDVPAAEQEHDGATRMVPIIATGIALAVSAGIVLLTPVARVQPYYLLAIVPVAMLVVGAAHSLALDLRARVALGMVIALACVSHMATSAPGAAHAYVADSTIPRYVRMAEARGVEQIITVAHYDALLVAYYLAKQHGRPLRGSELNRREDGALCIQGIDTCVVPLVRSHQVQADTLARAAAELHELIAQRRSLVVTRDAFRVPELSPTLSHCRTLDLGTETSLLECGRDGAGSGADPDGL